MSVVIPAAIALQPGCKLVFNPPFRGDHPESSRLFDEYKGKECTFLSYAETLVGPLDFRGLIPGRYLYPKEINVKFCEDGEVCLGAFTNHFVVLDPGKAVLCEKIPGEQRLGDLPHPVLFYPTDTVRLRHGVDGLSAAVSRMVQFVYTREGFIKDGVPYYEVMETEEETEKRAVRSREKYEKCPPERRLRPPLIQPDGKKLSAEVIELVERGNVWALYENPSKLKFPSDEEESEFWAQSGISRDMLGTNSRGDILAFGYPLGHVYRSFEEGIGDIICRPAVKQPGEPAAFDLRRLHNCFEEHRTRVRELTTRLWAGQLRKSVA